MLSRHKFLLLGLPRIRACVAEGLESLLKIPSLMDIRGMRFCLLDRGGAPSLPDVIEDAR
jgi:hypothetical protein